MVNGELIAMRVLYLIAALLLASETAQAWEVRTSCTSSRFYGNASCRTVGIPDAPPAPRDAVQEAEDLKARQERIGRWETFCRPTSTEDKFGVVRMVYAHANCDFARTR